MPIIHSCRRGLDIWSTGTFPCGLTVYLTCSEQSMRTASMRERTSLNAGIVICEHDSRSWFTVLGELPHLVLHRFLMPPQPCLFFFWSAPGSKNGFLKTRKSGHDVYMHKHKNEILKKPNHKAHV